MNSKRFLALALCLLLMAALLPTGSQMAHAATADECPSGGEHNWVVYENPPTCTNPGMREYQCTKCFASRGYEEIPALGHSWGEWVTRQEATCTESGTRYRQCTRCNEAETEAIPAKGHTPVTVPGTAATCTEAGLSDGAKCSVCGAVISAQQTIPALGHSYQNGVCVRCGAKDPSITPAPTAVPVTPAPTAVPVTPAPTAVPVTPAPATAAPVTAAPTQKPTRRPTARPTATPAPAPVEAPFSGMDIPSGFGFLRNGDPIADILRIVQQPQGGFIPKGSYTELTVEAAGGEGEYIYEWWFEPALPMVGTSALTDFLTGMYGDSVATVSQAKDKTSPIAAQLLDAWKKQNGIPGTVDHSVTVTEGTIASTETETMTMEVFNPLAENLGTSPEPGCNAWKSGTYWCVVYDEAGHHATSNKVQMKDGLYIAVQPESKNLFGFDSVTLTCRAGGGSGNYAYTWYDAEGNMVSDEATFPTSSIGEYHCFVSDFDTLETAESETVQVYSEDITPVITSQPNSVILDYREDGQYSVTFTCQAVSPATGDDSNLDYVWETYDNTKGWVYAGITYYKLPFSAVQPGTICRCKVTDKETGVYVVSNEAKVSTKLGADLSLADLHHLSLTVEGGSAPYTIYVHRLFEKAIFDSYTLVQYWDTMDERYKTEHLNNSEQASNHIIEVPAKQDIYYVSGWEVKSKIVWCQYYVEVFDNMGQRVITQTVNMENAK